jgi:hypothetical protein
MTALEITHSQTPEHVASLLAALRPVLPALVAPHESEGFLSSSSSPPRLGRPMVSYDLSGVAVGFLPEPAAAGNTGTTYHDLRRRLHATARTAALAVAPRYHAPSAHVTLARFVPATDLASPAARKRWVARVDEVNAWLEDEVWGRPQGEWVVGALECRAGAVWYGGGDVVARGREE